MTRPDTDAIRKRLEAATPGEWKMRARDVGFADWPKDKEWPRDAFLQFEVEIPEQPWGRGDYYHADATLIAHAPTDLAALLAYVAALEALLSGDLGAAVAARKAQEAK